LAMDDGISEHLARSAGATRKIADFFQFARALRRSRLAR